MCELFGLKMWNVLDIFKFYIICCRDVTWCHLHLVELGSTTRCWSGIHLVLLLCRTLSYSVSHQTSPGNTKSWSVSTLCLSGNSVCLSICFPVCMNVGHSLQVSACLYLWVIDRLSLSCWLSVIVCHSWSSRFQSREHCLLQLLTCTLASIDSRAIKRKVSVCAWILVYSKATIQANL